MNKKYIKEAFKLQEEYLVEMAIINPKMCRNLTIQVEVEQKNEGPIPHLHVYHDKSRNPRKCSYIRLDEVAYVPYHDEIKLPEKLKSQFIELMTAPSNDYMENNKGTVVKLNGYQTAVKTWVDTFEDDYSKFNLDEDGIVIPLDYTKLK